MCGQYSLTATKQALLERYAAEGEVEFNGNAILYPNLAHPVLLPNHKFYLIKWGFTPSFAKRPLINARIETVLEKKTFREPFMRKRCIIPATHFYEWEKHDETQDKIKWTISLKEQQIFSMAGICERYSDGKGGSYLAYAILTTEPNPQMAHIHDRMPVILEPSIEAEYLDLTTDPNELLKTISRHSKHEMILSQ